MVVAEERDLLAGVEGGSSVLRRLAGVEGAEGLRGTMESSALVEVGGGGVRPSERERLAGVRGIVESCGRSEKVSEGAGERRACERESGERK